MSSRTVAPTPAQMLREDIARRKNHPAVLASGLGGTLAKLDQFIEQHEALERTVDTILPALARVAVATGANLPGVIFQGDREAIEAAAESGNG